MTKLIVEIEYEEIHQDVPEVPDPLILGFSITSVVTIQEDGTRTEVARQSSGPHDDCNTWELTPEDYVGCAICVTEDHF